MTRAMPMDPVLRKFLDESVVPAVDPQMPNEQTVRMRRAVMSNALASRDAIAGLPNGATARDVKIAPELSARLYSPPDAHGPLPLLVYMHGGGWVVGSIETHDPFCRLLCEPAGAMILSLDYRLAPEHRFPAALEDVLTAFAWAAKHAASFGGDARRILLGGDSAGANLAAVAANRLCTARAQVKPAAQLLLYPVTDHPSAGHASYTERGAGCGLDAGLMRWFWDQYVAETQADDAEISPLRLERVPPLPPTMVATAEYDPLRDEGVLYAEKLKASGVRVTHLHAMDMHHNFPVHPATVARFPQPVAAVQEFAGWVKNVMTRT